MNKKNVKKTKKRKLNKKKVFFALVILIAFIYIINCRLFYKRDKKESKLENNNEISEKIEDKTINIVSIGDTLVHQRNYEDAYDEETGEYDFSSFFKDVKHYFDNRTIGICNLETTMAGKERGYSGYPTFNTPDHLAIDLKELGIDIATTANNHALDLGYSGLVHHLNLLDETKIEHTGSSRSVEEQNTILIKDLNEIKIAFLAYTYGTNGIPSPKGKEYCVNRIDKDLMKKQIDKAKSLGAELICVSMHWGQEYKTIENKEQDDLAKFLIKNDVQIILGCHPHVLEPLKTEKVILEDGTTKMGYVIYSMGNFFSAQTFENTRNSAIFNIKISKNLDTNKVSVDEITYFPTYCYDNGEDKKDRYEILDLNGIIESYEKGETTWSKEMYDFAKTESERAKNIIGPEIINRNGN